MLSERARMEDMKRLLPVVVSMLLLLHSTTHGFVIPSSSTFNGTRSDSAASSSSVQHRKFLRDEPERAWGENKCSGSDIVINQGPTPPLPNGIPTYTVEIMNVCVTGCDISGIHLSCGWFSSARLINPRVFKRISFDDCLVNDGKRLTNGATVSFQYANTFPYRLSVSSVIC